jgi:hypothetical protein
MDPVTPRIKIANKVDSLGVRCPYGKVSTLLCAVPNIMRPQLFIKLEMLSALEEMDIKFCK